MVLRTHARFEPQIWLRTAGAEMSGLEYIPKSCEQFRLEMMHTIIKYDLLAYRLPSLATKSSFLPFTSSFTSRNRVFSSATFNRLNSSGYL